MLRNDAKILRRMFELGDNSTALYNVGVIIDPLSETAQKWSSLLHVSSFHKH